MNSRKKFIMFFALLPIVLSVFYFLSTANRLGYVTRDSSNVMERQIFGASNFIRGKSSEEESTLYFSEYILSNYFVNSPLWGTGLLYTKSSYGLVSPEKGNVMDAGLAVYLSEFGLIGIFLYILYQILILFDSIKKSNRKYVILLYIYALVITVADAGIFQSSFMSCILIISHILSKNNLRQSNKQNSIL